MSNKLFYPICLALVLALAGFAQAELLVNGDFEAGTDSWKTWGSGSGSGAGGWWWSSAYGATVIEDGTAQSGNNYIEVGFWPPDGPWWGYCYAFQEHPATEGKTYQMSAWLRDGNADGAPSLIAGGGTIVWEWRVTAPVGGPDTGDRGDLVDIDGDGVGGNSDKIHYSFDLTEDWTYASTVEVAPPGANGLSVIFGTPTSYVNVDIDAASFVELVTIPVPNAGFEDPVLAEDDWTWLDVPGWTWVGGEGPGIWNVTINDFDPVVAPEGQNVLYTENAVGDAGGVAQVLTETFAANTNYTLTVDVGNSWSYYWSGYSVQLLAGGIVIAEDNDTLWPDYMLWATSTVVYTYDPADSSLVGQPLEIRLLNLGLDKDSPPAGELVGVEFDNVTLSYAAAAAAPNVQIENWEATVALASPGFLATNVENGTYDIGAFSGDMTYEFVVNSNPDEQEVSMALIGRLNFGDTRAGLKYEQWENTGTYGATVFGVADHDYGVATKPGLDTHLVFVSSGEETALYVNGAYRASIGAEISLSGIVGIGRAIREDGTFVDNFDGSIFGVAIYDTALSADQIQAHSDAYFMPLPDVTAPGDTVQGVPDDGDWPGGEPPLMVIDDDSGTKFLHFGGNFDPNEGPSGFRVTASASQSIVTTLTFTTANDAPERDPVAFELSGSNESIDGPYTLIASGDIVDFNELNEWPRFTKNETPISFDNEVIYAHYQVLFTAIRDAASANSMQIAEVELLGIIFVNYNATPADGAIVVPDTLSWTPGENAVSHDVYFGTSSPPAFIGNQAETSYDPILEYGTTYYWQVDAVEADGTARAGRILSFKTPLTATTGTILREVWTGIGGGSVSDLTGNANYPTNPSYSDEPTLFETPTNFSDDFGSRVHGYLHPETSGDYLFWIATDDSSELWLSTDESPANAVIISTTSGWAGSRDFDSGNVTPSGPISLVGGQKYYVSGIYKEGGGGDNLAVAWEGPDSPTRAVIDGYYLSPFVNLWAWAPSPADGAEDVLIGTTLSWMPAVTAATHDVYFGTSSPQAFIGNQEATTYYPGSIEVGTTYYWQIDTVEADGTTTAGDLWSFTTGFGNVAVDIRIATGDDDVEERLREDRNGDLDMGSSDLEFPYEDFPIDDLQRIGMRFVNVGVPQGAQIVSSYIEFEVDEIKDDANSVVNVIIDGQLTPDAEPFVDEFMNVSQRPAWTSTVVPWSVPYWIAENDKSQTPDISVLVQELVNQADWAGGNAMVFTIQDDPANPSEGNRAAESYNGESSNAPLLHIEAIVEAATGPSPADGAENVPIDTTLSWWPGFGAVSHDGYMGVSSPPTFIGNTPEVTFDPGLLGGLAPSTTYYWQLNAVDADGTTHTGDIWSFTTEPGEATQPDPADMAAGMALDTTLSWSPGVTAATHDVYFGTSSPPAFIGNQTDPNFDPGPLEFDTTYYWQVDEVEADGTTKYTGDIWSFSTLLDIPITDPSLLGWWTFDGVLGSVAVDYSGHNRYGTFVGDISFETDDIMGPVLSLPGGSNQFVKVGEVGISGTDERTIACWAKADNTDIPDWTLILGFTGNEDGSGGTGSHFNIGSLGGPGGVGAHVWGWEETIFSDEEALDWHHYAMTYDGTTIQYYGDGALMDTDPGKSNVISLTHADNVHIGSRITQDSSFPGKVDDARIYNIALSEAELRLLAGFLGAWSPDPADGTTDVPKILTLSWSPGPTAISHDVYFSADQQAVIDGTALIGNQAETSYTPTGLAKSTTYYWRVDEVEADGTTKHTGDVWSFTVTSLGR